MANLIIHTEEGSKVEVSPDAAPELHAAWKAWQDLQDGSIAEPYYWHRVIEEAGCYLDESDEHRDEEVVDVHEAEDWNEPSLPILRCTVCDEELEVGQSGKCESCNLATAPIPPDPEGGNSDRAEEAEQVLFQYESGYGEAPYVGIRPDSLRDLHEQNLSDLICNFGHFCDRNGLDMKRVLRRAKGHYDAETDNQGAQFTESN